jgi:DNA (cytosine-5)-methyltransferase 1
MSTSTEKSNNIKVVELFAGVGGFRIGLESASKKFKTVWSNQWEPSTKKQDASEIYVKRFGATGHCNKDITTVPIDEIPDHDMLVGGFPCQDYSVATTLKNAKGLHGKKGVLWWEIYRILNEKKKKPKYLFLENVDRLLKSPSKQRGRDFAVMLSSLSDLGYIVEWRVINAAEYGMPQRRRRVFFLAYHKTSDTYKRIQKLKSPTDWVLEDGPIAKAFPVTIKESKLLRLAFSLDTDVTKVSETFNKGSSVSPFENTGIMIDRVINTLTTKPDYQGPYTTLGEIILLNGKVPQNYYLDESAIDKWSYLKGAKNETRINKAGGFSYSYNEGAMVFPDPLDKPSRTIITGEGGPSPSRFKHVIRTRDGRLRRLMPLELERLNMFPDEHTEGLTDSKRAFMMGNALVVGVIEKIGSQLLKEIK